MFDDQRRTMTLSGEVFNVCKCTMLDNYNIKQGE